MVEEVTNLKWSSQRVMAHGKAVYRGHPVAAVGAVDQNTALEALKLIEVEYEPLEAVISLEDAMKPDAVIIHDDLVGDHLGEKVSPTNVAEHTRTEFGDPEAAFAEAAHVLERTYTIARAHQGYIEPHSSSAFWSPDDKLTVWTTTQAPFGVRNNLATVLKLPLSDVRVVPMEIGGGFGGKINLYMEPLAAMLSRKSGRPVKITMDRKSVFDATGPGPGGQVTAKIGVDRTGRSSRRRRRSCTWPGRTPARPSARRRPASSRATRCRTSASTPTTWSSTCPRRLRTARRARRRRRSPASR